MDLILAIMMAFASDFNIPVSRDYRIILVPPSEISYEDAMWGRVYPRSVCKDRKKIYINIEEYNKLSDIKRMGLIYHELGHCALNLRDTVMDKSLMNTDLNLIEEDGSNWSDLVDELKARYAKNLRMIEKEALAKQKSK